MQPNGFETCQLIKFKDKNKRAGDTRFVASALVRGSKAGYILFVISEVHPFLDGKGRNARVKMNAELTTSAQTKIIILIVYREDYLGRLRRLTRK